MSKSVARMTLLSIINLLAHYIIVITVRFSVCRAVRRDLGPALSLAQQEQIMQATAALYDQARAALSSQLQRFEEFALETCLCIPPGLVTSAQV